MKIVVWASPASFIEIKLINSFDEPITAIPIEEARTWTNDFIPTLRQMIDVRQVDEILFLGPKRFVLHLAHKVQDNFPDINVLIGDDND